MSKWTPGPWSADIRTVDSGWEGAYTHISIQSERALIADYPLKFADYPESDEESAANARLIAAAPEMAELLAEFVRASERPEYRENAAATLFCLAEEARALLARVSE